MGAAVYRQSKQIIRFKESLPRRMDVPHLLCQRALDSSPHTADMGIVVLVSRIWAPANFQSLILLSPLSPNIRVNCLHCLLNWQRLLISIDRTDLTFCLYVLLTPIPVLQSSCKDRIVLF